STQLIQADDIESLYAGILDTAVAIMGSDFASFQVLQAGHEGQELLLLGHRGFSREAERFFHWVGPYSASSCGAALRTGRRCVVPDVETCEFMSEGASLEAHRQAGIRSAQTTPLYS